MNLNFEINSVENFETNLSVAYNVLEDTEIERRFARSRYKFGMNTAFGVGCHGYISEELEYAINTILTKFNYKQIKSIVKLSKFLIKKYKIKSNFILGHSDISPDRKKDPGEKFPWHYLSKKKIGIWHNLEKKILVKNRNKKLSKLEKKTFVQNLYFIGYSKKLKIKNTHNTKLLTIAFQRRFRQELINGIIDKECLIISKKLIKKFK